MTTHREDTPKTPLKAKDAILIASHLVSADFEGARRARTCAQVAHVIGSVRSLGLNPIVVLGPAGDEVLRTCPELEDCDLVFDPNFSGDLFSSVQAGTHAATGACFILPLGTEATDDSLWSELDRAAWSLKPDDIVHVLQAVNIADGDIRPVFPQLVTRLGVRHLRDLPVSGEWGRDARISIRLLPANHQRPTLSA